LNAIIALLYRNIFTSISKLLLVWIVIFPIFLLYTAGFSYSPIVKDESVRVGNLTVSYPVFLATGMVGFNVMNVSTVAGSITWRDKRSGMLAQLFVMRFSRTEYLAGNLLTIVVMGFASAVLITIAGLPITAGNTNFSLLSIPYLAFAITAGSIFFGSVTSILSAKLRTSEGFDTIVNGIFLFFSFASSAFYPVQNIPEALRALFYLNPLTYVVDISRAGFFSQVTSFTTIEVVLLALFSAAALAIAIRSFMGMNDSQVSTQV
jgi:ABC-2 type transport system permease protein